MSTPSSPGFATRGSLPDPGAWRPRSRTLEALGALIAARTGLALIPFRWWRGRLGLDGEARTAELMTAQRLSIHVERAAGRLPFETKCLPRAMALSAMLRRRAIPHRVILAARPAAARRADDDLHAWVDVAGTIVLGDLPGPWLRVLVLPRE